MNTNPLEPETRDFINTRLRRLGWILDSENPNCNVFQERAKTVEQARLLQGKHPDYVLYQSNTNKPIAIIEAKRPGLDLDQALQQAIDYANLLSAPLAFACNKTFVTAHHILQDSPLKMDGEEIQNFIDDLTLIKFLEQGAEIISAPLGINITHDLLIEIFKRCE